MVKILCRDALFPDIEAIVFDKDGTLAHSETYLQRLAQRRSRLIDAQIPGVQEPLLMAFGVENGQISPMGLMSVGTRGENEIAAAAYVAETGRSWMEARAIARTAFAEADQQMQRKAEQTPLAAGALPLVQALAAAGLRLGILSSDSTANVQDFVQQYGLSPYFSLQMGSDTGIVKPDPALLLQACQALAIAPAATLVIGDSQADIQLAKAAGAAGCIGVTWGWAKAPWVDGADAIADQIDCIQVIV